MVKTAPHSTLSPQMWCIYIKKKNWFARTQFSTQNLFQVRACGISARKAKLDPDVPTMFTYSHANTPLGQSERAYYLSYFINSSSR